MLTPDLCAAAAAAAVAERLKARGETVAVAESAAGGLVSAALVGVPGASAYYAGGAVVYTLVGAEALLSGAPPMPEKVQGASEPFGRWLAEAAAVSLKADWGIGETGTAGPSGNMYGVPAGRAWVAVRRPDGEIRTRQVLSESDDRVGNMQLFAAAALALLLDALA